MNLCNQISIGVNERWTVDKRLSHWLREWKPASSDACPRASVDFSILQIESFILRQTYTCVIILVLRWLCFALML